MREERPALHQRGQVLQCSQGLHAWRRTYEDLDWAGQNVGCQLRLVVALLQLSNGSTGHVEAWERGRRCTGLNKTTGERRGQAVRLDQIAKVDLHRPRYDSGEKPPRNGIYGRC